MPELPEVETIKNQLKEKILGKSILDIQINLPRLVKAPLEEFKKEVLGAEIKDIRRRAKLLIFDLSNGSSLIIHLKLTGQLIFEDGKQGVGKPHLIYIIDGQKLYHYDLRQFGYVKLVKTEKVEGLLAEENFGPEPLGPDFTKEKLRQLFKERKKGKVKLILMDQTFLAGLGNVYAAEVLFYAGIHPERDISKLTEEEIGKIWQGIREILKAAIEKRGSSVDTYVDTKGEKGGFIPLLKVYGREGKPCFRCKTPIKKIELGGRGTYFCPICQT